jgi:hypothetical protein
VWKTPVRLTAIRRSHSASSISSKRAERPIPAAFTRMSRRPNARTAAATEARTAGMAATSQTAASAVPPARRMVATVPPRPSWFTSTPNTLAPSAAKSCAVARPSPDPAPVM